MPTPPLTSPIQVRLSRSARAGRYRRAAAGLLAATAVVALLPGFAFADDPPVATPFVTPPDVMKTMDDIGDLDLLTALIPLKLTPEEIDKLLAVLKTISQESDARIKKNCETLRSLAADVAKARTGMLAGKPLDTDLGAKVEKTYADIDAKYASARQDAIERTVDAMKDGLTTDQSAAVEERYTSANKGHITVPANLRNSPEKTKAYLRGQALQWYADRILLAPRSIILLTALKSPPAPVATPPADTAPPAAPAPPAATTGTK